MTSHIETEDGFGCRGLISTKAERRAEEFEERRNTELKKLRADVIHWRESRRACLEAGDILKIENDSLRAENADLHAEIARLKTLLAFPKLPVEMK